MAMCDIEYGLNVVLGRERERAHTTCDTNTREQPLKTK